MTYSETVVVAVIWMLLALGCFFGLRAAWRRRRDRHPTAKQRR